jgi:hypothetical protein
MSPEGHASINFGKLRAEMSRSGYSKKMDKLMELVQLKCQLNKYRTLKREAVLASKRVVVGKDAEGRYPVELYRPYYEASDPQGRFGEGYALPNI